MYLISWIVMGLVAGAIAKAILNRENSMGWLSTMFLGIVGAIVGGFLGSAIFGIPDVKSFFELRTWLLAIAGSVLVLFIIGAVTGKNKS